MQPGHLCQWVVLIYPPGWNLQKVQSLEILHIPDSGRVYALPAPRLSQLRHRVVEDITIPQMRKS